MNKRYEYQTRGVCSSKIIVECNGDTISYVEIIGGCPGNTKAVGKLCVGRKVDEVIDILKGIDCRGRGTSCPDQVASALEKLKEKELVGIN